MQESSEEHKIPRSQAKSTAHKQSLFLFTKWLIFMGTNFVPFGLELCASAGFIYIPPLLLKIGFSETSLTVIMGLGPCISLLTVPVIGHWSDRCFSPFGRRRPFILALGLLMLLSLLMIPFHKEISVHSFGIFKDVFILVVGIILLDFSSQALMNPTKALISDIFKTNEEQSTGFTVYSCMLSLGGCLGYLASSINWAETPLGDVFGSQEKAVFSLLALSFSFLLLINLNLAKELPLKKKPLLFNSCEIINHFESAQENNSHVVQENYSSFELVRSKDINLCINKKSYFSETWKALQRILSLRFRGKNCFKGICCCISIPMNLIFTLKFNILRFWDMPAVLVNLFMSNLFGWMGIMCHDLYYTDFVGQVIYQGQPKARIESASLNLYDEGVRMGSWGLLLHCLFAAVYAALIQRPLILKFGLRAVYLFGVIVFSLSLLGTVLTKSIVLVNCFAALSGTGYAVITTVPYSLVASYHNSKKSFQVMEDRGIGEDLAILDSAFFLAQIIPSFFLGYVVDLMGSPSTYMVIAALCGSISSIYSFFIHFDVDTTTVLQ